MSTWRPSMSCKAVKKEGEIEKEKEYKSKKELL